MTSPLFASSWNSIMMLLYRLALTFFIGFHFYLIAKGKTTLEHISSRKQPSPYVKDSLIGNFEEVMGPVSWKWLIPTPPENISSGWRFDDRTKVKEADLEEGVLQILSVENASPSRDVELVRRQRQQAISLNNSDDKI
mmetsp:Transcript_2470/g.3417  ORF Transcript_2470/g.3417 Transcript_2470/m.3417 type:complete len:138 (-) Transcript_2470:201-614(-)